MRGEFVEEKFALVGEILGPGGRGGGDVEDLAGDADGTGVFGDGFADEVGPLKEEELDLAVFGPTGTGFDGLQDFFNGLEHGGGSGSGLGLSRILKGLAVGHCLSGDRSLLRMV